MIQCWPDWSGETVVIVASGPSAKGADLERMRGRARFIAINDSWRLCPWADVLYACDGGWWRDKDWAEFSGLKITYEKAAARQFSLMRVDISMADNRILTEGDKIGNGANSGFQALNLAVKWGAKRVLLVGYDMTLKRGIHWHGPHKYEMNNPREDTVRKWLAANWSVPEGIEVINCCPESGLKVFPLMSFEQAASL